MADIRGINDKLFKKVFGQSKNARDFLKRVLPQEIKKRLNFASIKVEPTDYVSNEFQEGLSDIVVKAKLKGNGKNGESILTDIYFILEHKTESKVKVFIQILKYMCLVWEQDSNAGKPLRPIIPIIFYHGKPKWNVPDSFAGQFEVDDEVKPFMLDFKYVLFDTNEWNFRDSDNNELKKNVFLFTAMAVMKAAYKKDLQTIDEIFHFWQERGFVEDRDSLMIFLTYISQTQGMPDEKLKKMLEKNKIDGGKIMETMAERWEKKGEDRGILKGKLEGKLEGRDEQKHETALELIKSGIDINIIIKATGIAREEVEKMMETVH